MNGIKNKSIIIFIQQCQRKTQLSSHLIKCIVFYQTHFLILLIVQIRKTSKLKKRLDKFLTGKDGTRLEQDIAGLYEDNKFLKANTEKNKKDIRTLYKNLEAADQIRGMVQFDAFKQMGGEVSG